MHHTAPFPVAKDGDDDIEGIEARLEGDVFVEIKDAGCHIDYYPNEPLLQIFPCQSPDAYKT